MRNQRPRTGRSGCSGFTLTELVHDYGSMCAAITELAEQTGSITPREYQTLNQALDAAIAASVVRPDISSLRGIDHERVVDQRATRTPRLRGARAAKRDLRRADLVRRHSKRPCRDRRPHQQHSRAQPAAASIADRQVADQGVQAQVRPRALPRAHEFRQLIEEVEASASIEAPRNKGTHLHVDADPELNGSVDRRMIASVLANLVQNAIKYSPDGSQVFVRCRSADGTVLLEGRGPVRRAAPGPGRCPVHAVRARPWGRGPRPRPGHQPPRCRGPLRVAAGQSRICPEKAASSPFTSGPKRSLATSSRLRRRFTEATAPSGRWLHELEHDVIADARRSCSGSAFAIDPIPRVPLHVSPRRRRAWARRRRSSSSKSPASRNCRCTLAPPSTSTCSRPSRTSCLQHPLRRRGLSPKTIVRASVVEHARRFGARPPSTTRAGLRAPASAR